MTAVLPVSSPSPSALPTVGIEDLDVGTGDEARPGRVATVHYVGRRGDGVVFDDSRRHGQPVRFTVGGHEVIAGWDEGVLGMKVGGRRRLTVPPELGFGASGVPGVIPPGATLDFEVELVAVADPAYANVDNAELERLLADGAVLVDIRTPQEWSQTGVVEGSHLIPLMGGPGPGVAAFLGELAAVAGPDDPVVLICRTGSRTRAAAELLGERAGYTKVYNVAQGIMGWLRDRRPVVPPSR